MSQSRLFLDRFDPTKYMNLSFLSIIWVKGKFTRWGLNNFPNKVAATFCNLTTMVFYFERKNQNITELFIKLV